MGVKGKTTAILLSAIIIVGLYLTITNDDSIDDDIKVMQLVFRLDKDSIHSFEDINITYNMVNSTIKKRIRRQVLCSYLDELKFEYEYGTYNYDKAGKLLNKVNMKTVILNFKNRSLRTTKFRNEIFYK